MSILKIIEELRSTTKRGIKESILSKNKDNQLLKNVFFITLDFNTNFFIKKIPEPIKSTEQIDLQSAIDQLETLSSRKLTGNAGIEFLATLLGKLNPDDAEVLKLIIKRDLNCGISTKTINKIWKDLIPEYEVMTCSPISEKLLDKIKPPYIVQKKEDGLRVNVVVFDGSVTFYARSGLTLDLLGFLEDDFIRAANGKNLMFDGELLVGRDGIWLSRKEGNGILSKANSGTLSTTEAAQIGIVVWDVVDYDNYKCGLENTTYSDRLERLKYFNLSPKIKIIESDLVYTTDEIYEVFDEYRLNGFEGVIVKDPTENWSLTRSKRMLKIKGEEDCTLRVIGTTPHSKKEGQIGALICSTDDEHILVDVGSGLNDELRILPPEHFIGKLVDIRFNEPIRSKGKTTISLYLPRFIEIRIDKNETDTTLDILERCKKLDLYEGTTNETV